MFQYFVFGMLMGIPRGSYFPFLGCLHPQVSLHKAVGYSWQEEGGQPGTESFRVVREV